MKMRRVAFVGGSLVLVAAAALAAWAGWAWRRVHEPYKGFAGDRKVVEIPAGASARAIVERLAAEGVLRDPFLVRLYLRLRPFESPLQAGEYAFTRPLGAPEVLTKLASGDVVLHEVTIIEGLTRTETARTLADSGFGSFEALEAATADPTLILDLDPQATDLEGYLFPETYSFPRTTTESQIVARLVATFRQQYLTRVLPQLGEEAPSGVRRLVTLASIVEKEAQIDEERPVIAAVYTNRLERDIGLFADPTVIYALKQLGRWDGNIRKADLELDHPYNTYRHAGLPPGPIASPGLASLLAAAQPADVPYLYFVSRNDGRHVFASTLREHNQNVDVWQRQYWRRKRNSEPGD